MSFLNVQYYQNDTECLSQKKLFLYILCSFIICLITWGLRRIALLNNKEILRKITYKGIMLLLINLYYFRTSFRHLPSLNGKEIDLYLLYWLVTAQGGWEKVNNFIKRKWKRCFYTFWYCCKGKKVAWIDSFVVSRITNCFSTVAGRGGLI